MPDWYGQAISGYLSGMTAERADTPPPSRDHEVVPSERPGRFTMLRRAWKTSSRMQLPLIAAGVAFYAFLAIIPTLIAAVLVYGLVSDPEEVTQQVEEYASALPTSAQELLTEQMSNLAGANQQALGIGLIIALVVALWSASTGTANLIKAINLAYDGADDRGFVKTRALALLFTLGAIIFFIVVVALVTALPAVLGAFDLPQWARWLIEAARWLVLILLVITALAVLYRWAPEREGVRFRWITFGAILATLLWAAASIGFAIYVDNFGSYAETYGSLAGVVVLLLWLWLGAFAALFGAAVNAEGEKAVNPGEVVDRDKGPDRTGDGAVDRTDERDRAHSPDDRAGERPVTSAHTGSRRGAERQNRRQ